jgi:hypothetical protein
MPCASAIILNNVPYHSVHLDKVPSKYAVKKDIIKWLQRKGISCDFSVGKEKLFMLVKENQPKEKSFRIDQ